jgi:hypothetical protein
MKMYGKVDVEINVFLISELVRGGWSASPPNKVRTSSRKYEMPIVQEEKKQIFVAYIILIWLLRYVSPTYRTP